MNTGAIIDKVNLIVGGIVALLSYIFGEHWILFAAYLILNVADWITRWIASRLTGSENSKKALTGILKKFGYWVLIGLSFGASVIFVEIGEVIGVNLHVTTLLGWFVLASLLINEIRSILENLVDGGFHIPKILTKGLETANRAMDITTDKVINSDEEDQEEK